MLRYLRDRPLEYSHTTFFHNRKPSDLPIGRPSKISGIAQNVRGYRGSLVLESVDDPDAAVIITIWADKKSLDATASGEFKDATKVVE